MVKVAQYGLAIAGVATQLASAENTGKPVSVIMTRAGAPPEFKDGKWSLKYPLDGVNLANLPGALKYVITECIDKNTGVTDCERKNGASSIYLAKVTFQQPEEALWYFSKQNPNATTDNGMGPYLTYDAGTCAGQPDQCKLIAGNKDTPALGPYVGWKDDSTDHRNPTKDAAWWSIPGACPMKTWQDADDKCKKLEPNMVCDDPKDVDGKKCTYSYEVLGQVNIDELVGIAPEYKDYKAFCEAGNVEFERYDNFSMKQGLDFWKDPLNETANADRVLKLMEFYNNKTANPNNMPLPDEVVQGQPLKGNPGCYENIRSCTDKNKCVREKGGVCNRCSGNGDACPDYPSNWASEQLSELKKVTTSYDFYGRTGSDAKGGSSDSGNSSDSGKGGSGSSGKNAASMTSSTGYAAMATMAVATVAQFVL